MYSKFTYHIILMIHGRTSSYQMFNNFKMAFWCSPLKSSMSSLKQKYKSNLDIKKLKNINFLTLPKRKWGHFRIIWDEALSAKQVETKDLGVGLFFKMQRVKCVSKDSKIDSSFDISSGNLYTKISFIAVNVIFPAIL